MAAQYDLQYQTTHGATEPSNFSPIALNFRALPTDAINATFAPNSTPAITSCATISAQGTYTWTNRVQTTVGWSKRGYIAELPGFDDCRDAPIPPCVPASLDHRSTSRSTCTRKDNQVGSTLLASTTTCCIDYAAAAAFSAFYNAQCCGIAFEYQTYNFGPDSIVSPIPADHRFFLSFTLAGLGNFSPFNGALSGAPH